MRKPFEEIRNQNNLIGAEIGVFQGKHAKQILEELDIEKLYLIDPYEAYEGYDGIEDGFDGVTLTEAQMTAQTNLKGYEDQIIWITDHAHSARRYIPNELLDFLYIDGNHTFEHVYTNLVSFLPLMKDGGLVAGDDYRQQLEARVADAIDYFCKTSNFDLQIDHTQWWFYK